MYYRRFVRLVVCLLVSQYPSVSRSLSSPRCLLFWNPHFWWPLPVVDRGTLLVCPRSAPGEKPEATIGKWLVCNFIFEPVSRPRQGDAVGMSVSLSVPHPSALVFSFRTVHRYGHGLMLHRRQLCPSAKLPHSPIITSFISPSPPYYIAFLLS